MKFVALRLIGTGTETDPFRVPLPTYGNLRTNTELGIASATPFAIVEVRDEDYEPPADGEAETVVNVPNIGPVIRGLASTHRTRWLQRIRRKYQEKASSYALNVE